MSNEKSNLSPLMRQYYVIKNKYPDTLLLFQVGDFYELFFEDAQLASSFLGITLTKRGTTPNGEPIPLCGVPLHVVDHYVTKLVKGGFKVAICDQLEANKSGKIIERGITQVLTPGTLTDTKLLDEKTASYLCSFFVTQECVVLSFAELLTGQLFITTLNGATQPLIAAELARFMPDEIIIPDTKFAQAYIPHFKSLGYITTTQPFEPNANNLLDSTKEWFLRQFSNGAQIFDKSDALRYCLVNLFSYLQLNNERSLEQLKQLFIYNADDFLMLDTATQRNLELIKNTQDNTSANTLFSVLDNAVTAMGSRTIKKWLQRPLIKAEQIEQRLDAVEFIFKEAQFKDQIRSILKQIGDIERVIGRIALKRANLHDYIALLQALTILPELIQVLSSKDLVLLLGAIRSKTVDFEGLHDLLQKSINEDTSKQWLVKSGFNSELDRLRSLVEQSAQAIIALERKEQESTGINSLKIRFNGAHGYGLEVTKPNLHLVPSHYVRVQTLVNRERFTNQELKDLEYDITRARTDINEIEKEIFESIKLQVEQYLNQLKKLSQAVSYLDALQGLAHTAYIHGYTRPKFNNNRELVVEDGCHPVIKARIGTKFIPNKTELTDSKSLWIVTGPNMGGKSTYLRQTALISIMAQLGSFVPAREANLCIVDRIFTRIGAADNVAEGKSTFLVEMEETALICTQATKNSLVILDEVGRGTSTFDGLAIAQAVVEYIYQNIQARCLFATHYHELANLSSKFSSIVSYYASSTKTASGIVLLHKILPGIADGSFGLEVAKLASLPQAIIDRAHSILSMLERTEKEHMQNNFDLTSITPASIDNAELIQRKQELEAYISQLEKETGYARSLEKAINDIDLDHLTAKQALDLLWQLKDKKSHSLGS